MSSTTEQLARAMTRIRERCPQVAADRGLQAVIEAALLVELCRAYDRGYYDGHSHSQAAIHQLEARVAHDLQARRACTCGHGLTLTMQGGTVPAAAHSRGPAGSTPAPATTPHGD